jgi:hypothetical protein
MCRRLHIILGDSLIVDAISIPVCFIPSYLEYMCVRYVLDRVVQLGGILYERKY